MNNTPSGPNASCPACLMSIAPVFRLSVKSARALQTMPKTRAAQHVRVIRITFSLDVAVTTANQLSLSASRQRIVNLTRLIHSYWLGAGLFCIASISPAASPTTLPAIVAISRQDRNSQIAHEQLLAKAGQAGIDVYFEGDSITRRWGAVDYPDLLANWKQNFFGWNAADFGWGGDRTQNILWRLENGELDGVNPKVVILLAGTNNLGDLTTPGGAHAKADGFTRGFQAILHVIQKK